MRYHEFAKVTEAIGEDPTHSRRTIRNGDIYQYMYDKRNDDYYCLSHRYIDNHLLFNLFKQDKDSGKYIRTSLSSGEDVTYILNTILNDVLDANPDTIEFPRDQFNSFSVKIVKLLQNHGYYFDHNNSKDITFIRNENEKLWKNQ